MAMVTTWVSFYQQITGTIPHNIGVFRTLGTTEPAGTSWEFEGAALSTKSDQFYYALETDVATDMLVCRDFEDNPSTGHYAVPFANDLTEDDGNAFADDSVDPDDESWGQPFALDAYSQDVVFVGFQGYDYAGSAGSTHVRGRIAYTTDGGENWESVPFADEDGDFSGSYLGTLPADCAGSPAADPNDCWCDGDLFFDGINDITLLADPGHTYPTSTDWHFEMFVSSAYNHAGENDTHWSGDADTGSTADWQYGWKEDHCSLAKLVIEDGVPEWTWYTLDNSDTAPTCSLSGDTVVGVAAAPSGESIFVWGGYRNPSGSIVTGGVCEVDVDDPATLQQVVDPLVWQFDIGDVEPHPWVNDLLLIAPQQTTTSYLECLVVNAGPCLANPVPLIAERGSASTWFVYAFDEAPAHQATGSAAWGSLSESNLFVGTAGGGAYRGDLSWD